jgi:hypothetical protein
MERVELVSPYEDVRATCVLSEIAQLYAPSLHLVVEGVNSSSPIEPQMAAMLRPYSPYWIRTSENLSSTHLVNKGLLVRLLALRGRIGAQP